MYICVHVHVYSVCFVVVVCVCVLCDSTGTVVSEDSIAQAVQQFKTSREFKCDKIGNIHLPIGKVYTMNTIIIIIESREVIKQYK